MKSKLAVLLVFAVAGLLSFLLWWLVWGGSGALSGRASITKDGAAEPVANADIFLMEASEQVADFRKAVTGYIRAISVTRQVEGEVNAANKSAEKEKLAEGLIRLKDARRRQDYARLQLEDSESELIKRLAIAGVKMFRKVLEGDEPKAPKGFHFTRTDFDGRFQFKDVSRGNYYVFLPFRNDDLDTTPYLWMVPVRVGRGTQALDLTSSNALTIEQVKTPMMTEKPQVNQPAGAQAAQRPNPGDEITQPQRKTEQRQEERGTWRLVETVYERDPRGPVANAVDDILKNPEKFQSRGVTSSLRKDECNRMAASRANMTVRRAYRKVDTDERITIVIEGWPHVTVRDWQCLHGDVDEEALARERTRVDAARVAEDGRLAAAEQERIAKERAAAQRKEGEAVRQQLLALLKMVGSALESVGVAYEAFAPRVHAVGVQAEAIRVKYGSRLQNGEHEALSKAISEPCYLLYAVDADWRKERQAARDLANAQDAVDLGRRLGSPTQSQLKGLEAARRQYELAKMQLVASTDLLSRSIAKAMNAAKDDEERQGSAKPPTP